MNAREADLLGARIAALVEDGRAGEACALLSPVLGERTPFRYLDRIGRAAGTGSIPGVSAFLEQIAAGRTEGGWVVIASALGQQLEHDLVGAMVRCRAYVVEADVWYGADILGERVPGPALVADLKPTRVQLAPWREDPSRWVRRTVGVAVHFWAKRSRGAPEMSAQAAALLTLLEPMIGEWEMDAVKGVGWGLKTLGRRYPELVTDWLVESEVGRRKHRALMLRKATTYLSDEQRARVMDSV
ncbi:DNA alkylation repair protein [Chloroflexota bacterium]